MIIVNLKGGLGNQLFQYAFGKSLANKYSTKLMLDNSSYYGKTEKREYWLSNFDIIFDGYYENFKDKRVKKISNLIKKINFFSKLKIYNEKNFHFDPNIQFLNFDNYDYYFDGYWQSYKYFNQFISEIKIELKLENFINIEKKLLEEICSKDSLSLHIRGGDYKIEPFFSFNGLLNFNYYNRAVRYFKKNFNINKIFIFTDDLDYSNVLAKNFDFDYNFVSFNKSQSVLEDFSLLSVSRNKVISNSTFAWWASILNSNSNVIYPKEWFRITYNDTKDLFPTNWQEF